jgi:hypothetical protein
VSCETLSLTVVGSRQSEVDQAVVGGRQSEVGGRQSEVGGRQSEVDQAGGS